MSLTMSLETVLIKTIQLRYVVRQMVKDRFGIEVNYKRVWCAKQQALLSIYGTWEGSYSLLPCFLKVLQHFNPGLVVEWFFK